MKESDSEHMISLLMVHLTFFSLGTWCLLGYLKENDILVQVRLMDKLEWWGDAKQSWCVMVCSTERYSYCSSHLVQQIVVSLGRRF